MSVGPTITTTKGHIVFILAYSLAAMACYSLFVWNTTAASLLVLGYVIVAQTGVNAFFQHPSGDPYKRFIVVFLALGYVIIGGLSLRLWNENVTHEVLSGLSLFVLAIVKEYYTSDESGGTLPPPTSISTPNSLPGPMGPIPIPTVFGPTAIVPNVAQPAAPAAPVPKPPP